MKRDLPKADWRRAAIIGASGVVTAAAGIALTAGGHGFAIGAWIVMTVRVAGNLWNLTGEWAWIDVRAAHLIRVLSALAALATAGLGLALASGAVLGLTMLFALIFALGALVAHQDLPVSRALAILESPHRG